MNGAETLLSDVNLEPELDEDKDELLIGENWFDLPDLSGLSCCVCSERETLG